MSESAAVGRLMVSVLVVDAAQRVLMFPAEGPSGLAWTVPSGDICLGETPVAAARRVLEAATLQRVDQLVGPIPAAGGKDHEPQAGVFFLCRAEAFRMQRGDRTLSSSQGQWWALSELPVTAGTLPSVDLIALVKHNT